MQVVIRFSDRVLILLQSSFSAAPFFRRLSGCHRSPSADVVATVNGKEILSAELERNYQIQLGDNPQKPSPQEADILRLNVLQKMIQSRFCSSRPPS